MFSHREKLCRFVEHPSKMNGIDDTSCSKMTEVKCEHGLAVGPSISGGSRIFEHALFQLQSMGPIWKLWGMILGPNDNFLWKKFHDRSLRKKKVFLTAPPLQFFLHLVVFCFLKFNQILHRNSSTDFKFHRKICFCSRVIKFWIFTRCRKNCNKNSKLYNSWTEAYFSMKFEICRWISM